jgi:hypothetical protein
LIRRKWWRNDVALAHRWSVGVSQLRHDREDLIDGGDWSGAGALAGVTTIGVSRCRKNY